MGGRWWTWGQSWEIWLMRSQMKNLSQEIRSLQFDCPPSFLPRWVWIGQREAPVFRSLVNCVERFINMGELLFTFFWVFLSGRLLWLPLCNGPTGLGVGDWWLGRWWIRWQRGARTVPHIYCALNFKRGQTRQWIMVNTIDALCCTISAYMTTLPLILLLTINHSWRPPTMPKFSLRTVETRFWSILGQLKSPQETPACWWVIVVMSALPPQDPILPREPNLGQENKKRN